MKIVIIDNYDSFTYNLKQLLTECGATVDVVLNDKFVFSPGPGIPSEAGKMEEVIQKAYVPIY